jgi:hypothetical protein
MGVFLDKNIIGIALGIRFRRNFRIEDQIGEILDQILYSKDAYFNSKIFPFAASIPGGRMLHNREETDKLLIDNSNLILEIQFSQDLKFDNLKEILDNYNNQLIKGILKDIGIEDIIRIGYVNRYVFQIKKMADNFISKIIPFAIEGINDVNLNFTKIYQVEKALIKRDVNDYNSSIFNVIKSSGKDEIFISLDYQKFFDPWLITASDIEFDKFISSANDFIDNVFSQWLNKYSEGV